MSIHVMSWVLKHSEERLGNRLVLLALAEFAHDDGDRAFPSVETLSQRARMSERQVQYALKALRESGAIEQTSTTPKGTKVYRVLMSDSAGVQNPQGAESDGGKQDSAPDPLLTRQSSSSSSTGVGRAPKTISGVKVTEAEHDLVDALLARFNERAGGKRYAGKEWREAIVRRIRDHSEITLDEHLAIIDRQFEKPWWKGDPTPSVIWGNGRVFDRAVNGAQGPPPEEDEFTRDQHTR